MAAAKTALAPIEKTSMFPAFRSGRRECWSARTTDGVWLFERLEVAGTPWSVTHAETKTEVTWTGTLRGGRAYVAAGHAQADLDRLLAHGRGEHDAQREPACGWC